MLSQNMYKAPLLQPKQARERLIMSHRPNNIYTCSTVFSLLWNCPSVVDDARMADHAGGSGRWTAKLRCPVHPYVDFLDQGTVGSAYVMQNGGNDDQCWQQQE